MTQRIKSCNEIPAGKTYPVEHLRTAESIEQLCAYVDAGHPIATDEGYEARLLRRESKRSVFFNVDCTHIEGDWISCGLDQHFLIERIKLAPLAYRNGRPLHVGDDIEVLRDSGADTPKFEPCKACCAHAATFNRGENSQEWRFADEVAE